MVSLTSTGRRFETLMYTEGGLPFYGTVENLSEGRFSTYDFSEPRQILRLDQACPVRTGDVILTPSGLRFLLANHDQAFTNGIYEYRTHRLFLLNTLVLWEREVGTTNELTGLQQGTGKQTLGTFWAAVERIEREFSDPAMRVKEERKRVITQKSVEIGDLLNDMVVRKVDHGVGVNILEIQ